MNAEGRWLWALFVSFDGVDSVDAGSAKVSVNLEMDESG